MNDKDNSWRIFGRLSDQLSLRIFSELQGKALADDGVVVTDHHERKCYWQFWTEFVEPFHGVDAMLTNVSDPDRIDLLLGFAFKLRFVPLAKCSNW
jgi:hypothetical protein